MRIAALTASYILSIATLLPLVRREAWWIRLLDFPRPQITVGAFAAAASLLAVRKRDSSSDLLALGILGACAAHQSWEMLRYTPARCVQSLRAESGDPDRRVRILTANVLQFNRNVREYIDLIAASDPDLIVFAETDRYWVERLREIEPAYPHRILCPLDNTYGLVLYSRLRLPQPEVLYRVEDDVPSFRALVELRTGDVFQLHVLHPRPPHVGVDTVDRDAELVLVAKEIQEPTIVTGDLNDVAWSHTTRLFLRLSGLLDPRLGRSFCNTFHAHLPMFRWPLDHLFHSRAFRLVRFERGPKTASDHFPVLAELSYEPEMRHEQQRPVSDSGDHQEAERKIEQALEA